jgi:hypothetical protein
MSPPSPNGSNDSDDRGRFTKGNPGGPGNPHAAQIGPLRSWCRGTASSQLSGGLFDPSPTLARMTPQHSNQERPERDSPPPSGRGLSLVALAADQGHGPHRVSIARKSLTFTTPSGGSAQSHVPGPPHWTSRAKKSTMSTMPSGGASQSHGHAHDISEHGGGSCAGPVKCSPQRRRWPISPLPAWSETVRVQSPAESSPSKALRGSCGTNTPVKAGGNQPHCRSMCPPATSSRNVMLR